MISSGRSFRDGLVGYVLAILLTAAVVTVIDVVTFRPGGEFGTKSEVATFTLVVWAVFGLIGGAGFGAGFAWVNVAPGHTPLAGIAGFLAGTINAGILGLGVVGQVSRSSGLPQVIVMVGTALVTGFITALLIIAVPLILREHAAAGETNRSG